MAKFINKDLGNKITRIEGQGGVGMYLIEGEERAALIDAGLGAHDLKKYVETLTNRPVDVYLTHGHLDHAGGIYYFNHVYMTKEDIPLLASGNTKKDRLYYLELAKTFMDKNEWCEDDVAEEKDIDIRVIKAGDVIDLGGRTLEVVDFKGHTQGSVGFYDDLSKNLFIGDSCNNSTFMFLEESTSIPTYLETLKRIKKDWMGKIAHLVIAHDYDFIPDEVIDNTIECCENIINNTDDKEKFVHPNKLLDTTHVYWAKTGGADRSDGKFGNIAYNEINRE